MGGLSNDTVFPYGKSAYYNLRNYIEAKLLDSLQGGLRYYVTFFVNLADSSVYACNDIGAYFSDSALDFKGDSVKYYLTPQVANNPKKQELTDTLNWMKISGSFIPKGGEKYIIIGNFKNDSLSSIKYLGNRSVNGTAAYYYLDDVIVSPDSNYADSIFASVPVINKPSEVVKVFPNPSKSLFNFNLSNHEQGIKNRIEVYNVLGEKVYQEAINNATFTINLYGQPSGIYLYRLVSERGDLVASGNMILQ